jgi:hypothetical protein
MIGNQRVGFSKSCLKAEKLIVYFLSTQTELKDRFALLIPDLPGAFTLFDELVVFVTNRRLYRLYCAHRLSPPYMA